MSVLCLKLRQFPFRIHLYPLVLRGIKKALQFRVFVKCVSVKNVKKCQEKQVSRHANISNIPNGKFYACRIPKFWKNRSPHIHWPPHFLPSLSFGSRMRPMINPVEEILLTLEDAATKFREWWRIYTWHPNSKALFLPVLPKYPHFVKMGKLKGGESGWMYR
jgi:hypothetical protein